IWGELRCRFLMLIQHLKQELLSFFIIQGFPHYYGNEVSSELLPQELLFANPIEYWIPGALLDKSFYSYSNHCSIFTSSALCIFLHSSLHIY
ncbi:mCG145626, partial [Mus musculus]